MLPKDNEELGPVAMPAALEVADGDGEVSIELLDVGGLLSGASPFSTFCVDDELLADNALLESVGAGCNGVTVTAAPVEGSLLRRASEFTSDFVGDEGAADDVDGEGVVAAGAGVTLPEALDDDNLAVNASKFSLVVGDDETDLVEELCEGAIADGIPRPSTMDDVNRFTKVSSDEDNAGTLNLAGDVDEGGSGVDSFVEIGEGVIVGVICGPVPSFTARLTCFG